MNAPSHPTWAAPIARFLLAVALIGIGISGWVDGWGPSIVTIGTGAIAAELVGFGINAAQAKQIAAYIASLEGQILSKNPPPPPGG